MHYFEVKKKFLGRGHSIAYHSSFPRGDPLPRPSPSTPWFSRLRRSTPHCFFWQIEHCCCSDKSSTNLQQRVSCCRDTSLLGLCKSSFFYWIFAELSRVLEYSTDTGITGSYWLQGVPKPKQTDTWFLIQVFLCDLGLKWIKIQ